MANKTMLFNNIHPEGFLIRQLPSLFQAYPLILQGA
jgi:hypothetical protein